MKDKMFVHGKYFYGNEVSEYGQEHGYVDYATLAKAFDAVLNNDIMQKTMDIGYWEQESGFIDNSEEIEELEAQIEELNEEIEELMLEDADGYRERIETLGEKKEELQDKINELEEEQENSYNAEIYQYYIVSDRGAEILEEANEIVFYNEELDMYVWGVTMFGTAWDYCLTNIRCNVPYEEE